MKTRTIILSFFTLILFSAFYAVPVTQAQDMKIGFVEPRMILERMPEMRAVQQRLQNFAERKQQELIEKERNLQNEFELYQQKIGVISEEARRREEERLGQLDLDLRQSQQRAQMEIQERRAELMAPLLQQIQQAIDVVAESKGIDYVLNTMTSTGDVIILYVSERVRTQFDITDDVMRNLGI